MGRGFSQMNADKKIFVVRRGRSSAEPQPEKITPSQLSPLEEGEKVGGMLFAQKKISKIERT